MDHARILHAYLGRLPGAQLLRILKAERHAAVGATRCASERAVALARLRAVLDEAFAAMPQPHIEAIEKVLSESFHDD